MVNVNIYLFDSNEGTEENKIKSLFDGCSTSEKTRSSTITTYRTCNDSRPKKIIDGFMSAEDRFIWESLSMADPSEYTIVCLDKTLQLLAII